ncbi:prion-inhibition and propagation-domain-containing protein [Diplogelasinospora grovesii]|uniref:Prion-inhibition and propagation-domain-containing protein n=1 Tax=Diplogelasinospora grovesii TaxID=303347 RepID=A0AAN6S5V8_9PEZI|nr:prion-inhibition and propagation-domain-containing protein [Diplogelasinospora grovesii]
MDPASAAALGGGMVSLAFDVFDNTIRLLKFLGALVDMPQDCQKYRLQLIMEYNRVLAFGKAAGLVDVAEGSSLGVALGTNATELVSIVARIQWLLAEFREINGRYGNELNLNANEEPSVAEARATDVDVVQQVSSLAMSYEAKRKERRFLRGTNHIREFLDKSAQNIKEVVTHPARVRWVAVDQEAFQALLADLHVLTERLHELIRDHREKKIDDITAKTYREMILARNDMHDLKDMLDAVTSLIGTSSMTRKEKEAHHNDITLQDLVRLKKISQISDAILAKLKGDPKASSSFSQEGFLAEVGITVEQYDFEKLCEHLAWDPYLNEEPHLWSRPTGILTTGTGEAKKQYVVWVEWKHLGDYPPGSTKEREFIIRTVALAEMLHMQKPASMYVPECLGYYDDRDINGTEAFGWIFKAPVGVYSDCETVSLYDMISNTTGRFPTASLAQRISLARKLCSTVLHLHAVNWLHKCIFSENVVFNLRGSTQASKFNYDFENNPAQNTETQDCLFGPLLSGFEFGRPDDGNTTARDADSQWDIYRWPTLQRQPLTERSSKKTYDLYSLGLLLLEIAHWKPLHVMMCLTQAEMPRRRVEDAVDDMAEDYEPTAEDAGHDFVDDRHPAEQRKVNWPRVPLEESKAVRDWLLGIKSEAPFEKEGKPNPLAELRNVVGDKYASAVVRCLWAHGEEGFGVGEQEHQSKDSEVGIKLQEAFTHHVVEPLNTVAV